MNIMRFDQSSKRVARPAPPTLQRMQRELAFTRRLFEVTFHSAAMGKATVDVAGRCIDVNTPPLKCSVMREENCEVCALPTLHMQTTSMLTWNYFRSVKAGERDSYQIEKRYLKKDGGIVHTPY